jgi:hypothetical protein
MTNGDARMTAVVRRLAPDVPSQPPLLDRIAPDDQTYGHRVYRYRTAAWTVVVHTLDVPHFVRVHDDTTLSSSPPGGAINDGTDRERQPCIGASHSFISTLESKGLVVLMLQHFKIVSVDDKMQRGYCYALTEPMGRNFDPEFRPELTPPEMLALGVFCGKYMTDCRAEFPASWFERARLSPSRRDCSLNYFGIDASQPLSIWREKGWIHPDDPRGWFQCTVATIWGAARRMTTRGRSDAGRQCVGISRRLDGTAIQEIHFVDHGNDKHCCIGLTIAEKFEIGTQVHWLPAPSYTLPIRRRSSR